MQISWGGDGSENLLTLSTRTLRASEILLTLSTPPLMESATLGGVITIEGTFRATRSFASPVALLTYLGRSRVGKRRRV